MNLVVSCFVRALARWLDRLTYDYAPDLQRAATLPSTMSTWERRLARMVHKGLYALLIIAPATGIVFASAWGVTLNFFGLFSTPGLIETNQSLARTLHKVHYVRTHILMIVAGLHAMVALWRHFIRRNDILTRTLPKRHH